MSFRIHRSEQRCLMNLSQIDLQIRKKLCLVSAVSFAVLYTLYCFAVSPLYIGAVGNVAYSETLVPDLLYYLGRLLELVAISISYASVIYGIYALGRARSKVCSFIFLLATLYKYTANMVVSWLYAGGVSEEWIWDLINVLFYTLLEAIQLGVILLLVHPVITKFKQRNQVLAKAGQPMSVYPFQKLYDKSNCLMKSAMIAAVVVFVSKIFGQLVNDIYYILVSGLPKEANTSILMAVSYISNLLFGLICYIATMFTLMKIAEKSEK